MRPMLPVFLLLPATAAAQQLSPQQIAAQTRPAVVLVTALRGGEQVGQGSGFVLTPDGYLVTNRHVVEGSDQLRVRLSTGEIYDRVFFVSGDDRRDIVVLRIPAAGLKPLPVGSDEDAVVGDHVYVMGNPMGLDGTFSDGLISAKRTVEGVNLIQISAPISPGSSGGPVLNGAGEVIGIATLTYRSGQNLNLAVPVRYVTGLLSMHETPQPFESVAARFAVSDRADSLATASQNVRDELWAQVLIDEMREVMAEARQRGLEPIDEPVVDMINDDEVHDIAMTFRDRGETLTVVGVCDVDCSDLDLALYDAAGNLIVKDILQDDRPEISFEILQPGTFTVRVYMATCDVEPCAFAVQALRRRSTRNP